MSDLDLSMPEFKVPGVPGYTPPFGTKKSDGEPLTTEEVIKNMELLSTWDVKTINIDKEATSATYNIPNLVSDVVFFKPQFHASGLGSLILKIGKVREGVRMLIDVHSINNVTLKIDLASPKTETTYNLNGLASWLVTYIRGTFTVQPVNAMDNNERLKYYSETLATQVSVAGCILGKNLGDLFNSKDFGDFISAVHGFSQVKNHNIQIGDYYDIPSLTLEGNTISGLDSNHRLRIVVSGFNILPVYLRKPHVLWSFQNIVVRKMVQPNASNAGGFSASYLNKYLNSTFSHALSKEMDGGTFLCSCKRYTSKKSGFDEQSYKIFLPTEAEVFGGSVYGDDLLSKHPSIQFPIYRNSKYFRVKSYNGTYSSWWTASIRSDTNQHFCSVDDGGDPDTDSSSSVSVGVSPAFCTY